VNGNAINWSATTSGTWRIASAVGGITNFAADKFVINVSATNGTAGFSNPLSGGTFSLVQSGNDLNLLFTPVPPPLITINVASGTQTQTQAGYPLLSGTTPVLKTGAGTVVLNQANTLTGPTTVSQGTLQLAAANALSSSPLTVAAGATLAVGPQVATVVPSLVNNGLVDVGLGRLTVTSGQTADGIVAAIIAGRTDGTWSGTAGITSSAAATQSDRAVGWLDNGDGSFTVAFGAAGDWNLNGFVDFDDVVQFVSAELYNTGLPATWADGDFDYNGMVDFDDIVAAQSANLFNAGPYNMGSGGGASLALGGGIVAVPEPATWALGACGLVAAGWAGFRFPRAASMHRRARYTWAADAIGSRVGG
jgi:autotransporter-associated beta strand protein